jgi:hypothetical protein
LSNTRLIWNLLLQFNSLGGHLEIWRPSRKNNDRLREEVFYAWGALFYCTSTIKIGWNWYSAKNKNPLIGIGIVICPCTVSDFPTEGFIYTPLTACWLQLNWVKQNIEAICQKMIRRFRRKSGLDKWPGMIWRYVDPIPKVGMVFSANVTQTA